MITSWTGANGYLFGTTLICHPSLSFAPLPTRRTSGGVRCSYLLQKGQTVSVPFAQVGRFDLEGEITTHLPEIVFLKNSNFFIRLEIFYIPQLPGLECRKL